MEAYIAIYSLMAGIISLFFSKSKRMHARFVEGGGEDFANKAIKTLEICGYILLVCAALSIISV